MRVRAVATEIACGVLAGPLFVGSYTAIGARRTGYDWRRHAVSSLASGPGGWSQRVNFAVTGALYCVATHGVARSPKRTVGPRVVPALVFGVGVGLAGSGLFVTDPVAGFPPSSPDQDRDGGAPRVAQTRSGKLHTLFALPISAGTCSRPDLRHVYRSQGEYRWALYSAGSAIAMPGRFCCSGWHLVLRRASPGEVVSFSACRSRPGSGG